VGPWFQAQRAGDFDVTVEGNCQNVVNPLADVGKYLPHTISEGNYGYFEDEHEVDLYNRMLRELDKTKQKQLLLEFNKYVLDEQAHGIFLLWWQRIVPYRSYVKGWKIGPSHYVNQDLATIWLDK